MATSSGKVSFKVPVSKDGKIVKKRNLLDACTEELDKYKHFMSGSTPMMIADKFKETFKHLHPVDIEKFASICIVAATTQKKVLEEILSSKENERLADYINAHWSLKGSLNFSALNMLGHCMLFVNASLNNEYVADFRKKAKADSIWEADLDKSSFSAKQIEIYKEKVKKVSIEEAFEAGEIIGDILEKLINDRNVYLNTLGKSGEKGGAKDMET